MTSSHHTLIDTAPGATQTANPVQIIVFHDTACPWCRIGYANLRRALAEWTGPPVTVAWHPFQLNPNIPVDGAEFQPHLRAKYGLDDLSPMFERVTQAGAEAGLTFRFDKVQRAPNTIASHVLYGAVPDGQRDDVIGRTYDAYFEDGRDIGDPEVLVAIATEAGVDPAPVRAALSDPDQRAVIGQAAREASQLGVSGVPFFIFAGTLAASGAQPPDLLRSALDQALTMRRGD